MNIYAKYSRIHLNFQLLPYCTLIACSRINTYEDLSTEPAESCSIAAELPVSCCLEHDAWLFWNWKTRTSWFDLNPLCVSWLCCWLFFGVRHGVRISCWLASGRRGRCRAGNVCMSQVVQVPLKTCSSWPIGFVRLTWSNQSSIHANLESKHPDGGNRTFPLIAVTDSDRQWQTVTDSDRQWQTAGISVDSITCKTWYMSWWAQS